MPMKHVWVRSVCYVLFVPWVLIAFGAAVAAAVQGDGWPYIVALASVLFVVIAIGLGGVDIWNTYRGPHESVEWPASRAVRLKCAYDQTASAGPLETTLAYRHAKGLCVVKLRAPIGPHGKLRLVVLRSEPHQVETLARVLSGAPSLDD